ncbi:hypothetical protein RQP46_002701 [Phenoliferia psychrophenolica]
MSNLSLTPTVRLRTGGEMPLLGFGVYQSTAAFASTSTALAKGYRHVDSAVYYTNERDVALAVRAFLDAGGEGDVWITSKVYGPDHATELCQAKVEQSIANAEAGGLKWDLYLLHDPTAGPVKRLEAWRVLERAVADGYIKHIVSQSDVHLEEFKAAGVSQPEVNQIEGIIIQAYCPLVRGLRMEDPTLLSISQKTGRTPAQVLIRWSLQRGFVPLPKNADVYGFALDKEDMERLDGLDEGADGACQWNPVASD